MNIRHLALPVFFAALLPSLAWAEAPHTLDVRARAPVPQSAYRAGGYASKSNAQVRSSVRATPSTDHATHSNVAPPVRQANAQARRMDGGAAGPGASTPKGWVQRPSAKAAQPVSHEHAMAWTIPGQPGTVLVRQRGATPKNDNYFWVERGVAHKIDVTKQWSINGFGRTKTRVVDVVGRGAFDTIAFNAKAEHKIWINHSGGKATFLTPVDSKQLPHVIQAISWPSDTGAKKAPTAPQGGSLRSSSHGH